MASIRVLPEILSNQIAAGEVVERPASVVKELLENAIDAKSDRIHVEIEQGGRSLIRVADNGQGMGHDDALLAIERYATSKIFSEADLSSIRSLGFRGEALPSIAAVSKFSMVTRDAKSDAGTEIIVEGGKIKAVNQTGAPPGTMVSARQLFFNTPARRKFLKTVNTEMGHISEIVSCIALARPDIGFRLIHNSKTIKDWPGSNDAFERVADVLGSDLRSLLYPLEQETAAARISGWIADPSASRSSTNRIYVYVNGRFVRDRSIIYALAEGCRGRLMKGRFPMAVLFLDIPHSEVDVNVHPAKQEVRFFKQREVVEAVRRAVENAWRQQRDRAARREPKPGATATQAALFEKSSQQVQPPWEAPDFQASATSAQASISEPRSTYAAAAESANTVKSAAPATEQPRRPEPQPQTEMFSHGFFSEAIVLGQFRNTYIICEKLDELLLVDQHAAHERIVYERLSGLRKSSDTTAMQRLLMPETVELRYREAPAMEQLLPELNAVGFEIEHFGGETFVVKAVPDVLAEREIAPLVTDLADTAGNFGTAPDMTRLVDQCLILMACHGAIRANQALTEKEMTALLKQLDSCDNPFYCPHGRPTLIRWSLPYLEKNFRRIV
ncbi:MAG: DNA mismatch repair endonuclease MutL [Desulfobacterales bacterium]